MLDSRLSLAPKHVGAALTDGGATATRGAAAEGGGGGGDDGARCSHCRRGNGRADAATAAAGDGETRPSADGGCARCAHEQAWRGLRSSSALSALIGRSVALGRSMRWFERVAYSAVRPTGEGEERGGWEIGALFRSRGGLCCLARPACAPPGAHAPVRAARPCSAPPRALGPQSSLVGPCISSLSAADTDDHTMMCASLRGPGAAGVHAGAADAPAVRLRGGGGVDGAGVARHAHAARARPARAPPRPHRRAPREARHRRVLVRQPPHRVRVESRA